MLAVPAGNAPGVAAGARRTIWILTGAALGLAAGAVAAAGYGGWACLAMLGAGWMAVGAHISFTKTRSLLLLTLLLVPDMPSGQSWGLVVRWSQGLTLSNFVVPALALPLLAGAWLAGNRLNQAVWPGMVRCCLWLLAWCWITLALAEGGVGLASAAGATLVAHLAKLTLFLLLGLILAGGDKAWMRARGQILVVGIAANAAFGLGQAVGWLPVFSPLGQEQAGLGIRVSGLFYDANMYGVLAAWALLWLLCQAPHAGGRWRWAWGLLTLAVALNLVATGSRAGYLALGTGCIVLLLYGRGRAVARGIVLLALLAAIFPARSWQRVRATLDTVMRDARSGDVAAVEHPDAGTQERLDSMDEAWRQIRRHPLLGLGFGRALYEGVPAIGAGGPVRPAADPSFNGAQNMALTVLAETGPVGLVLLVMMIAGPLRRLGAHTPGLPILAGYAGLLAACFTIEALWNTRLLALVVVLIAVAIPTPKMGAAA